MWARSEDREAEWSHGVRATERNGGASPIFFLGLTRGVEEEAPAWFAIEEKTEKPSDHLMFKLRPNPIRHRTYLSGHLQIPAPIVIHRAWLEYRI